MKIFAQLSKLFLLFLAFLTFSSAFADPNKDVVARLNKIASVGDDRFLLIRDAMGVAPMRLGASATSFSLEMVDAKTGAMISKFNEGQPIIIDPSTERFDFYMAHKEENGILLISSAPLFEKRQRRIKVERLDFEGHRYPLLTQYFDIDVSSMNFIEAESSLRNDLLVLAFSGHKFPDSYVKVVALDLKKGTVVDDSEFQDPSERIFLKSVDYDKDKNFTVLTLRKYKGFVFVPGNDLISLSGEHTVTYGPPSLQGIVPRRLDGIVYTDFPSNFLVRVLEQTPPENERGKYAVEIEIIDSRQPMFVSNRARVKLLKPLSIDARLQGSLLSDDTLRLVIWESRESDAELIYLRPRPLNGFLEVEQHQIAFPNPSAQLISSCEQAMRH